MKTPLGTEITPTMYNEQLLAVVRNEVLPLRLRLHAFTLIDSVVVGFNFESDPYLWASVLSDMLIDSFQTLPD